MTFRLVDYRKGIEHQLEEGDRHYIGRDPTCGIPLEVNGISRQHCEISVRDGKVFVKDLGSKNGTFINGERIEGKVELGHSDQLSIANVKKFRLQTPEGAAAYEDENPTPVDEVAESAPVALATAEAPPPPVAMAAPGEGLPPVAPDPKKKMIKVIIGALSGVLSLVILASALIGKKPEPPPKPKGPSPQEVYTQNLDRAIQQFRMSEYDLAEMSLDKAINSKFSKSRPAKAFRDLVREYTVVSGDLRKLNFNRTQTIAEDLKNTAPTSEKELNRIADEQRTMLDFEVSNRQVIEEAIALAGQEDWQAADAKLINLHKDSVFRVTLKDQIDQIVTNLNQELETDGDRHVDSMRWSSARGKYRILLNRLSGAKARDPIEKKMELVEQRVKEKALLEEMELDYEEGLFEGVKAKSIEIAKDSPYREEADDVLLRINNIEIEANVKNLYETEKADEALKYALRNGLTEDNSMVKKISEVFRLHIEADKAIKGKEYKKARDLWGQLVQLEDFANNPYRLNAEHKLDEFNEDNLSQMYIKKAIAASGAGDFEEARINYEKAEAIYPGSAIDAIQKLSRDAKGHYNWARNMHSKKPKEALERTEQAMKMISESDPMYSEILTFYEKLKAAYRKKR